MDFESLIPILLVVFSVIASAVKNSYKQKEQQNNKSAGSDLPGKDNNKHTDKKYRDIKNPKPAKSIFDELFEPFSVETYSEQDSYVESEKSLPASKADIIRKPDVAVPHQVDMHAADNQKRQGNPDRLRSILNDKKQLKSAFVLSEILKCKF